MNCSIKWLIKSMKFISCLLLSILKGLGYLCIVVWLLNWLLIVHRLLNLNVLNLLGLLWVTYLGLILLLFWVNSLGHHLLLLRNYWLRFIKLQKSCSIRYLLRNHFRYLSLYISLSLYHLLRLNLWDRILLSL